MHLRNILPVVALFLLLSTSLAQPSREVIEQTIERDGCAVLETSKVKVCKYDYLSKGDSIEAISFQPAGEGRFPSLLLIPGYQRTARDQINFGVALAREGFASIAITQPGFGKSQGKPDYVGPNTLRVLSEGFNKFKQEQFVDKKRLGIYGYSRGGMAASLLVLQMDDVRAAIFGAGIYDFKRAYDEIKLEGIRKNMEAETGMTAEAIAERSSVFRMDRLKCPVLILHGEKDVNVPVSQALLLRDRLTQLKKEFEIKLYPEAEHSIGGPEIIKVSIEFFKRKLSQDPR
jgi:dipeptidyl aminopeptidase/acylaminoacyl peptidase